MMANYHEISVRECTKSGEVGLSFGEAPNGEERICIALGGPRINPYLTNEWEEANWISLSEECAITLYDLLHARLSGRNQDVT